ncbi:uncharacterized protein PGTG_18865 [Puccinia graminis f. sp. tritici CRL 75-36-700-3]|uniref:Uncharacterized protein n=1 Tax=Puccinia graminis f. sp. tritici (strain CRL 75-36-700-3 / race SCCL) TaxID=418459 RepID=E3L8Z9_PUCGT|nr:uncharacterized protein PGTG_18865 [Puccinia graminis f. sp. tritici CRL 75-36-700-3]EFP93024.1 hypothetical protein PGTG_18865 [Puccinia graminis f. sp. tritici CRL 75-36-700-3]
MDVKLPRLRWKIGKRSAKAKGLFRWRLTCEVTAFIRSLRLYKVWMYQQQLTTNQYSKQPIHHQSSPSQNVHQCIHEEVHPGRTEEYHGQLPWEYTHIDQTQLDLKHPHARLGWLWSPTQLWRLGASFEHVCVHVGR